MIHASTLNELGSGDAGLSAKHAGKMARAHASSCCEHRNGKRCLGVLYDETHQIANWLTFCCLHR